MMLLMLIMVMMMITHALLPGITMSGSQPTSEEVELLEHPRVVRASSGSCAIRPTGHIRPRRLPFCQSGQAIPAGLSRRPAASSKLFATRFGTKAHTGVTDDDDE